MRCEVHAAAAGCVDRKPGAGRCLGILHIASCLPTIALVVVLAHTRYHTSVGHKHTRPRHPAPQANKVTDDNTSVCLAQEKQQRHAQSATGDTHKTGVQSSYFFTQRVKASESVLKASVPRNLLLYPLKAKMQHGHVPPMSQKRHEKWTCTSTPSGFARQDIVASKHKKHNNVTAALERQNDDMQQ